MASEETVAETVQQLGHGHPTNIYALCGNAKCDAGGQWYGYRLQSWLELTIKQNLFSPPFLTEKRRRFYFLDQLWDQCLDNQLALRLHSWVQDDLSQST